MELGEGWLVAKTRHSEPYKEHGRFWAAFHGRWVAGHMSHLLASSCGCRSPVIIHGPVTLEMCRFE